VEWNEFLISFFIITIFGGIIVGICLECLKKFNNGKKGLWFLLKRPSNFDEKLGGRKKEVIKSKNLDDMLQNIGDNKQLPIAPVKKYKKRWSFIILCIISALILVGAIVFIVTRTSNNDIMRNENTITFTLSPVSHMSEEDYAESLLLITERIQSMTDIYMIDDNGGMITVTMLESDLSENLRIIEETVKLIATTGTFSIWGRGDEHIFALNENEILYAEVRSGQIHFEIPDTFLGNWRHDLMRESDNSNMYYICVTVNESGADKIRAAQNARESVVYIDAFVTETRAFAGLEAADIGLFHPIRGIDNEFYIILYDFNNAPLNNLVATIINQPLLPSSFTHEIGEKIIREVIDESTRGRFQQDEIIGNSVTLIYGFSDFIFHERLTEEDFANAVSILKNRMDAIGQPYVIGFSGLGGRNIAIKTSPLRMGEDFINLIGGSGEDIRIETKTGAGFNHWNISAFFVREASWDNYVIDVILNDNILDFEEIVDEILNDTVFLTINGVRVSSTVFTDPNSRIIGFSGFPFISHLEMSRRNKFILDLLQEIVNGEMIGYTTDSGGTLGVDLELLNIIWDDNRNVEQHYRWGVNSDSHEATRVRNIIAEQFENVTFRRDRGGRNLRIFLNLEVNDELPQRFLDLVIDIYTACDFDNTSYDSILFFNENNTETNDRFRIIFRRIRSWSFFDNPNVGKISYTYLITGPTFERYREEMETLFETLDFFINKPGERW